MPQGTKHQSRKTTKLLNMGDSGSGKTGALSCLLKAGYRLVILDFDNGLDILINLLGDDKEALERLYFETFTDEMKMTSGLILPKGKPTAFDRAMNGLSKWEFPVEEGSSETYNLGNCGDWGPDTIVVIDSLGFAANMALNKIRQLNLRMADLRIDRTDYMQAMDMLERMLMLLYSDSVGCNVIVNTHITYLEDVLKGTLKGMPRALGSKLPPKVGGYFNTIVRSLTEGQGKGQKRVIKTASDVGTELKLPVRPGTVPDTLPIDTGLLTIFEALRKSEWLDETPVASAAG